jgi:PAT family beta-lactamase induction signal transducer AmpG
MTLRRKLFWVSILYFAEGFPFGIVVDMLPVYFRVHGVSLTDIGLMSLLGMPWTLKVFWSPLVDRYGSFQRWILACLATMSGALALIPWFDPAQPAFLLWSLLFVLTMASATQDIAIDAYTINLVDKGEEGTANGFRVSAYRAALIATGGGLLLLSGPFGWSASFLVAAGIGLALTVLVAASPVVRPAPRPAGATWFGPFLDWLSRPGAWIVFLFVLTYKLGDSSMGPMIKPFWVDRGLSVEEIAFVSTTLGVAATVAGALAGGALTSRWGILRALWLLGLMQALSNLGYATVAWSGAGRAAVYSASLIESFTGGLGTAAFLAFMMRICDKRQAATEYALLSAIFGLTRHVAGAASGWAATQLGYAPYFALTFLLALPALGLLPWLQPWLNEERAGSPSPDGSAAAA